MLPGRRLALLLVLAGIVGAEPLPAQLQSQPQDRALVRLLVFNTNQTVDVELVAQQPQVLYGLEITLRQCVADHQQEGQDIAWLDVLTHDPIERANTHTATDTNIAEDASATLSNSSQPVSQRLFNGWMVNTAPAASALEHPVLDLRLLRCLQRALPAAAPEVVAQPGSVGSVIQESLPKSAPQVALEDLPDLESLDLEEAIPTTETPPENQGFFGWLR